MTFRLWCLSNSLMDDSIRLILFEHNLTGTAAKWYIKLPRHSFVDFSAFTIVFLTHFQLPICYKTGTDLLTSLHKNTFTHISDHIHEWRRWRRLIKAPILDQLLGYPIHLRKALWPSCVEQYTENNIQGDYYAGNLVVYHELHLLDNPGERPVILNPSY